MGYVLIMYLFGIVDIYLFFYNLVKLIWRINLTKDETKTSSYVLQPRRKYEKSLLFICYRLVGVGWVGGWKLEHASEQWYGGHQCHTATRALLTLAIISPSRCWYAPERNYIGLV